MKAGYDYPSTARKGLVRWLTHPLIVGLVVFYAPIVGALWLRGWL